MGTINIQSTDLSHKAGLTYTGTSDKTIDVNSLVSSTNIKTIGGVSLLGSGDVAVQATLVSGTNIKTINGSSLLGSGDVPIFAGFKNYIIDGNFDFWYEGTSQTSSGYGSDTMWQNINAGSTKTHSQQSCGDTERALFNSRYFSRTVVSSVAGAGNFVLKQHLIEDVTRLAGKTVTLSFWAKAESNKNIAIEFGQYFGKGGSPSGEVNAIGSQLVALTTTWQKKTVTVAVPSIVGKTLGTNGVNTSATFLDLIFDAGSDWNSRASNLGQQSGTFDIAQVQLEEGSVATPFENRPMALETQLVNRYYEFFNYSQSTNPIGFSFSSNGSANMGNIGHTKKRIYPSITFNNIMLQNSITSLISVTAIAIQNNQNCIILYAPTTSGLVYHMVTSTNSYIKLDARL